MTTVIYNKNTKEVLAVLPDDGEEGFIRDDIEARMYGNNEPCFLEKDGKILINENAVFIKL